MTMLDGRCHDFTFIDSDASSLCEPSVINFAYQSGKSSFQFVLRDKAIIGFFGTDSEANGDEAVLAVESITLNLMMGEPSQNLPASGQCRYTNPYAGPSLIRCEAKTNLGTISSIFVSDGAEPQVQEF